jgi:hypothetical protein
VGSSTIVDIADAVVTALNSGTFSQSFQAVRHYQPVFELKDMGTLHVSVVPKGIELELFTRTQVQADVQVDIGVQKKLESIEPADMDPLMRLVEEIGDYFRTHALTGTPAVWIKTENVPIFAPEHLGKLRQFTSVLTLTFRQLRR